MTDIESMIDNIADWSDDDIIAMLVKMHDEIHRMCVEYYNICLIKEKCSFCEEEKE